MCDTNNQLANAVPVFYPPSYHVVRLVPANRPPIIYAGVVAGVVDYPRCVPAAAAAPQPYRPQPETLEVLRRLHTLADELARLTLNTPGDEQAGVWAAYYALHDALTGAPKGGA